MRDRVLIVGAGFSGAVLARELVTHGGFDALVIDAREHAGGNCHTERDAATGVMVHRYGPHIFHTSRREVWDYLDRFGEMQRWINRVKASVHRGVFSLPINLHTINQFFGVQLNPAEARRYLAELSDKTIGEPQNFEEQALKFVGRELYETFFRGYSRKQWGVDPRELPASVLKRLPVRFDYNDAYYEDEFQGIPRHGYSHAIAGILKHPGIEVRLGTKWDPAMASEFAQVFYTGPIDEFFGHALGRLRYRTVYWDRVETEGDYQGNAVINYPEEDRPYTRVHEHKHFAPWERHERTVAFVEYSQATEPGDIPYYPLRLAPDLECFRQYVGRARATGGVSFLGRLATYRYLDMHHVIGEALDFAAEWLRARAAKRPGPIFPAGVEGAPP